MRSVCVDCQAVIGFKCGKCGSSETFLSPTRNDPERRCCTRFSCHNKFNPTNCRTSGGLCDACLERRLALVGRVLA
jgi:hypothetical protein